MEKSKRIIFNAMLSCLRDGVSPYDFKIKDQSMEAGMTPQEYQDMATTARKAYKKEQMVQNAIVGMLKQRFSEIGIPYTLERQKLRVMVFLKVGSSALVTYVYQGRYARDIEAVVQTAQLMQDAMSKIAIRFKLVGVSPNRKWCK